MSLLIDANTENVTIAHAASISDLETITFLMWWKPATTAVASRLFSKSLNLDISRNTTLILIARSRATTGLEITVDWSQFAAYALDTWMFLAFTWDFNDGTLANLRVLVGNRTTLAAEPATSYNTRNNGSGTIDTDSGSDLIVGNRGAADRPMNADVAHVSIYNRVMSVAEIQAQQFRRRPSSGCVLFHEYGYAGTGTHGDWSGNANTATVNSATVSDHVPLPWRRQLSIWSPYIAAPSAQRRFLLTRF